MRKKIIIQVLSVLVVLVVIATIVAYFVYADREWLSFYIACCGGVLVLNLIISIIFVHKNFKGKG